MYLRTIAAILVMLLATLGPAAADDTDNYQIADGLGVYLGIMPAAIVKGHPKGHAEAGMHGGPPKGGHEYHLVVAIFEDESGARVENANVTAVVSGLGYVGRSSVALEPMSIENTVTYGAFVDLAGLERFDVELTIKVPGRTKPLRVNFANEHFR